MPRTFRFKPALLRSAQDWTLAVSELRAPAGSFDLSHVTETRFAEMGVKRGGVIRRLDLIHPDGKVSVGVSGMASDRNVQTHADLVGAILERLAGRDPDIPLIIGEGGAPRAIMFGTGVVAALFSLVLLIAVLSGNGRSSAEVFTGAGALLLFGLFLCVRYWPWRRLPTLTVATAPALIAALKT